MSDLAVLNTLLLVIEVALASLVLPPLGWLLARTYRKSAAGRRLVWVMVVAVLLALPLLALAMPTLAVIALPAAPAPAVVPDAAPVATVAPEPSGLSWTSLIPLAGAVWLAGLLRIGVQHLIGLVRLELMRRGAGPWEGPRPLPLRGCQLLVSEECPGPMTWGVFRPVIMLPDEALDWPDARLEAALRHELAHVHRRDGLVQALAIAACALYWPNPLVWLAAKALRREAELAADDTVIASGVRPSDYASQLVELAAEWRERRLTPTGLAMAAPPALTRRVQSILSTDAIRTGATSMDALKLVLLGGAATAALTLARPSVAEVPVAGPAVSPAPQARISPASHPDIDQPAAQATAKPASAASRARARNSAPKSDMQLAQQDVPAPPAPPAPPPPPAFAAAPLPPLPVGLPGALIPPGPLSWIPADPNGPKAPPGFHIQTNMLTPEQQADLNRKLAAIGPAVDKAIAEAHIDETVQKALSGQDAKTREEVARQLKEIGPLVQQAIANAHIREAVGQRLAQIQPEMKEARKQAVERQAQAEERVAAQLEEQAKRARERAQRDRERLKDADPAPKN